MTDEERKRLCAKLRREYYDGEYAAGEIERLAAQMTGLEVLEIVFNMAVKYSRGPLTDEEMDALLQVRATIEQTKGKSMQYEDQLVIGNVFNTAIQQILVEFEGNADPNLVAALAQGILVRVDQAGYMIVKK